MAVQNVGVDEEIVMAGRKVGRVGAEIGWWWWGCGEGCQLCRGGHGAALSAAAKLTYWLADMNVQNGEEWGWKCAGDSAYRERPGRR